MKSPARLKSIPEGRDLEAPQAYCWACRALVVVPTLSNGNLAGLYKCGWCGALNPQELHREDQTTSREDVHTQPVGSCTKALDAVESALASACACLCSSQCSTFFGHLIVAFVVSLILGIYVVGIYPVLSGTLGNGFWFWVNTGISSALTLNILFNYALAVRLSAGNVEQFYRLKAAPQAFPNFTWCTKCQKHKPPNVHHCSSCMTCVVEMDHHCPFINNCVGRGNMRHFLLFLLWVVIAMIYAIPMCIKSISDHYPQVLQVYYTLKQTRRYKRTRVFWDPLFVLRIMQMVPMKMTISLYLATICLVVLAMCGGLCIRHWWLAIQGMTYVGSMKGESHSSGGAIDNLRHVFGNGHPLLWLLPYREESSKGAKSLKRA